jgi:hypothetical protein
MCFCHDVSKKKEKNELGLVAAPAEMDIEWQVGLGLQ